MIDFVKPFAEWGAAIIEVIGIFIIVAFSIYTLVYGVIDTVRKRDRNEIYARVRRQLGRGILLGLELLVAADIIHTVAVELTFTTVGVLAIIVLIRTFLSFTLDVELTGRWPWQSAKAAKSHQEI
ncbi:DUF1622 domain-containing protein [Gilvimarinus chinensis]|uniref:DUF1622 domain-containing protein n=1 Tax=Gilvimarinus chinensis TaxID=396005 RepID=UPI000369783D|nr:DUF1622 domain-containing protein [Gilvimarinus chinensis]